MSLNILIVEGIYQKTKNFIKRQGASASENLKKLVLKFEPKATITIINL